MRIDTFLFADCVDLAEHIRTAAVIPSCTIISLWRSVAEWRMMHGQKNSAFVILLFDALQLCCEIGQLKVGNGGPLPFFAGNDARIFQRVREESNDTNKGSIQGKVHTRLSHRS